jgi:prepilin-type processing-associated H-X9-DG protein
MDANEALVLGLNPKTKLHHEGGMNALLVDGSVRFLKATIPASVRRALMTISSGDDVNSDQF